MGQAFKSDDPNYFSTAPAELMYARIGGEAMGYRNAVFRMGDDAAENPPTVVMLYLPPGAVLPRHAHDCHRLEVIVLGSMLAEDGTWLHPGDVRTSAPGEFYGPHIAGPLGVLSVEVFSAASGVDASFPDDLPPEHRELLARAAAAVDAFHRAGISAPSVKTL
ncbi:MAG: hypothetical protein AB7Q97_07195 [Gammaproteobacteria bacterium]